MSPSPDPTTYGDPELYDLAYSAYRDDLDFYVAAARGAGGAVLEAACGTGRILIPTLQAGVDIDGFDLEPAMLERLKQKAAALGLAPRVYTADMRDFTLQRRYALVTVPFRAFMHLLTTDDQLRALRCMREHLEPGGALVLNFFYPSFERIANPGEEPRIEREFPHPETGLPVVLQGRTSFDRVNQLLEAKQEVLVSDARGYVSATRARAFTLRWTYRYEMELLLEAAGFTRYAVAGGFDGRPLERDTDEMVWTAWRDGA
jgi:SAM-dependent methyltransferase